MKDEFTVVHILNDIRGGAAVAALRIHQHLLTSGINSKVISPRYVYDVDIEKKVPNINFIQANWLKEKLFRIVRRLNPSLKHWRDRYLPIFESVKANIECERLSLPFSYVDLRSVKLIKEASVIHFHCIDRFLDYATFFRQCNKPVVWTLHDENPLLGMYHYSGDRERNQYLTRDLEDWLISWKRSMTDSIQSWTEIVAPSDWLAEKARSSTGFHDFSVSSIPYIIPSITTSAIENLFEKKKVRTDKKIRFAFVAQHLTHPRKGLDLLLESIKILPKKTKDKIQLLMIGEGNTLKFSEVEVHSCGFIGEEDKLYTTLASVDCLIIPSREDNLPNVMLEAFACGTPVITFNVGGLKEYVKSEFNGLLAGKPTAQNLSQAIEKFVAMPLGSFSAKAIHEYARQQFSPEKVVEAYRKLYCKLLN